LALEASDVLRSTGSSPANGRGCITGDRAGLRLRGPQCGTRLLSNRDSGVAGSFLWQYGDFSELLFRCPSRRLTCPLTARSRSSVISPAH
jgi:hypothetical protein